MKILFIPSQTGGWNLDPNTHAPHLDDLAIACELEAQGHDVWFCEYYQRKFQKIKWRKTFPKLFEQGVSDNFDALYVHPHLPSLISFLANPVMNSEKAIEYFNLVVNELKNFEGPIYCTSVDDREVYYKQWLGDPEYIEKTLLRSTFSYDPELCRAFPSILQRVQRDFITDRQLSWATKWCVENIMGRTFEKKYDMIHDGGNKWKDYGPERRAVISSLIEAHPNSATLGRMTIKGLPNLSEGKMLRGVSKVLETTGLAKYKLLSWEPFHFTHNAFWTTRTSLSMVSDSFAFTMMDGAPDYFPVFQPGELPEVTPSLIEKQHEIAREFARKDDWPDAYVTA